MEILVEILIQVCTWLLQLVGEILVQILAEAIAELLGHVVRMVFRQLKPIHAWLAILGYTLLGAASGGLSLLVAPELFIHTPWIRVANLVVTPIVCGWVMSCLGSWRRRQHKEAIRLESFAYGFVFAFGMAAVRYGLGK